MIIIDIIIKFHNSPPPILLPFSFELYSFELSAFSFELNCFHLPDTRNLTPVFCFTKLKSAMTHPLYHLILQFLAHGREVGIIARYSDKQMAIILGFFLGIA